MVTPNEQHTALGEALGTPRLYFKREDLHPLGSHKGRSIPHMIDERVKTGARHFAISSSGNAALAAALYVKQLNEIAAKNKKGTVSENPIELDILVGQNIAPKKLAKLQALKDDNIRVSIHDRPKQALIMKTKNSGDGVSDAAVSLRQSDDDTALVGYESLARELAEIPDLQAIFIGTSSGTTAQALAEYFLKNKKKKSKKNEATVQIHIVQTPSCHPIADVISGDLHEDSGATGGESEKSFADAIVDRTALRKDVLAPLVEKTGGSAWVANNESITAAIDIVKKHTDLLISPNSALSVAGLMQAIYTGHSWNGAVVCVICGD